MIYDYPRVSTNTQTAATQMATGAKIARAQLRRALEQFEEWRRSAPTLPPAHSMEKSIARSNDHSIPELQKGRHLTAAPSL